MYCLYNNQSITIKEKKSRYVIISSLSNGFLWTTLFSLRTRMTNCLIRYQIFMSHKCAVSPEWVHDQKQTHQEWQLRGVAARGEQLFSVAAALKQWWERGEDREIGHFLLCRSPNAAANVCVGQEAGMKGEKGACMRMLGAPALLPSGGSKPTGVRAQHHRNSQSLQNGAG